MKIKDKSVFSLFLILTLPEYQDEHLLFAMHLFFECAKQRVCTDPVDPASVLVSKGALRETHGKLMMPVIISFMCHALHQ